MGTLDLVVLLLYFAGLVAVMLAELVGELIERAVRGRHRDESRVFEKGKFRERSRTK